MKCQKCNEKNIISSNYCKKCGNKYTKEEQKKAKRWTLVWFLERIDNAKSILDLSFITGNVFFKIASILLVLGIGIYSLLTTGINLKILNSDNYKIQYNTKDNEYYLISNSEETTLNLYIPNRTNTLIIKHLNEDNTIIYEKEYCLECEVVLNSNGNYDYYVIETKYEKNNLDQIKLYVYYEE